MTTCSPCMRRAVASRASRSTAHCTRPAPATRQAAGGSSAASRPAPPRKRRARQRSSRGLRRTPIGDRSPPTIRRWRRCSSSMPQAVPTAHSTPASSAPWRACSSIRSSSFVSRPSRPSCPLGASTASVTSISRRAYRFSCGAAFPTTRCSPRLPPASCTSPRCSRARYSACSPTRRPMRSSRASRRSGYSYGWSTPCRRNQGVRRQSAPCAAQGDRAVVRERAA